MKRYGRKAAYGFWSGFLTGFDALAFLYRHDPQPRRYQVASWKPRRFLNRVPFDRSLS